jgi:protein-L-isoaspartate(D-aspartate) O-methyltransferase
MVRAHIVARGIRDAAVVAAMQSVPREAFLPPELEEFAYEDCPLPIEEGQTISQPYIVALMTAALRLGPNDRVLEVGTGSGYAAAILARVAREVYTIERHGPLAELAEKRLRELGFGNVKVLHGDGTLGWPEHAPYDGIVVAAGGPKVPEALLEQLAVGGRLVIPIGEGRELQKLVRVTREPSGDFRREELGDVRFVPLIGRQGWAGEEPEPEAPAWEGRVYHPTSHPETMSRLIREVAAPIERIEGADHGALVERIGDARLVLIGEATHGTSEFYRMRAEITKELIRRRGFDFVAIEGDWPDAARVNRWVQGLGNGTAPLWEAFARFPTWMWRNQETLAFIGWLRHHNEKNRETARPAGFYGLDLYSMFTSIHAVLAYLDRIDPSVAKIARQRYSCLTPWQADPQAYGRAAISGRYRVCEAEAVAMLRDLLERRLQYVGEDPERFLDAVQNAALVADAERYYRSMYYGANESWNLRDGHMFQTLETLLAFRGPESKAVVWEHNSHVGDARATEMGVRGQLNVGQLARDRFGASAFLIGFGTDHGTVAAASDWDQPMEVKRVRPSHPESYERLCHESDRPAFLLHLREPDRPEVRSELVAPRLERAIGVVYRPDTELQSHYFHASLPHQFDEFIWFDETRAVEPVTRAESRAFPGDHPFVAPHA